MKMSSAAILFGALRVNWDTLSQENKLIYEVLDTYAKVQTQFRCCRMRQSRLQQMTFINIFLLFFRENKT